MKVPALRQVKATLPVAAPTLIALVLWVVVSLVAVTAGWRQLELKLLDKLIVASAPNKSNYPITVVGIDAESFSKLGLQWPWPRSLHAELLDRLAADGAAVVVFDVVFSEASGRGPEDDQRLADSIQHAGNVVLAADRIYRETAVTSEWQRLDPLPLFMKAGAQVGLATVPLDVDSVVRQVPTSGESMWRTTVLRLIRDHPELSPNLGTASGTNIRYVGGDRTFPYVSYHEVVKPTGSVPEGFFKDQVVIVGFAARASPNAQSAQADLFNTPFSGSTGGQMPGAEVHANLIETALSRNAISRLPDLAVVMLLGLVAALSAWTMRRWRPIHSALWGGGIAMVIAALVWGVMLWGNLWVPSASMLVLVALLYVSLGGRSYLLEQARRAEITRAFSLYVTPQVVEQMIAHPEQMRLGGERRNITIMFTDLAGFTTISEAHSAERVTYLLNRHFTAMTDIVLEHYGTVARFIGDAIMAFWGAPLEDDDQAYRAVAAAIAMQEGMNTLRADFAKEGLPPIHMRVGIHSGSAVVGNLGSDKRFDYTAIGDDVNLSARLEGTNKLYGTTILVSQETVNRVGGRLGFRPVDKVVVKGKSQAVETFTPCANELIVDMTTRAIGLFRGQQWDAAQLLFAELLGVAPGDQIAAIYQQRIAVFRVNPPGPKWDGAVELDKL
jgi:adenylate cyclase